MMYKLGDYSNKLFFRQTAKKATYSKVNGVDTFENLTSPKNDEKEFASVIPALIKAFGSTFFFGCVVKFIPNTLAFVSPLILK